MEKENFTALLPYIITDLVSEIMKKQNITEDCALKKLYFSKLYSLLENEQTKLWQYSTQMLYSLFEQEEKQGLIRFPDV